MGIDVMRIGVQIWKVMADWGSNQELSASPRLFWFGGFQGYDVPPGQPTKKRMVPPLQEHATGTWWGSSFGPRSIKKEIRLVRLISGGESQHGQPFPFVKVKNTVVLIDTEDGGVDRIGDTEQRRRDFI
ncbi:hypothetical protein Patl1_15556 [Pistacia atlantica]|uniref:Uncharacterized protein n=1 Tax=Pistacia atlantica TaxID=434234 RepID=A0ACC1BAR2_9ROSI|nr:hypothetical protein Patl1_15556 [Pistacia atlantica]